MLPFLTAILIVLAGTVAAASHRDRVVLANGIPLNDRTPWTIYASYDRTRPPQNIVREGRVDADRLVFLRERLLQMEKARTSLLFQEGARLSESDKAVLNHDFYAYHNIVASEVTPNLRLLITAHQDLQKLVDIEAILDRLLTQARLGRSFH
ncbi:uncharacterized protein UTRI_04870_B [Ustilago trichophora]|uniref:Uncharacterized protein n=1 Tax=Ustilago trichophora TaxID=86804 RepID=A0A5C3EFF7_9BASI|nr:uncharacterized protein UTRI_04870_B [Ustilago trichophora]